MTTYDLVSFTRELSYQKLAAPISVIHNMHTHPSLQLNNMQAFVHLKYV